MGAARSLVLILVWVYYSGLILFFGAELTRFGLGGMERKSRPREGPVRVVEKNSACGAGSSGQHPRLLDKQPLLVG